MEDFADWFEMTFKTEYLPFNNSSDNDIGELLIKLYRHPQRILSFSSWLITTGRGDIFDRVIEELTPEEIVDFALEHYPDYLKETEKSNLWIAQGKREAVGGLIQDLLIQYRINHKGKSNEQTGKRTYRE